MKALSLDLRQRIADALDTDASQPAIAERFAVSLSSVERIAAKKRRLLDLKPKQSPGRPLKIPEATLPEFEALVRSQNDWTAQALQEAWQQTMGIQLSLSTLTRTLAKIGFTFKKNAASPGKGTRSSGKRSVSKSKP